VGTCRRIQFGAGCRAGEGGRSENQTAHRRQSSGDSHGARRLLGKGAWVSRSWRGVQRSTSQGDGLSLSAGRDPHGRTPSRPRQQRSLPGDPCRARRNTSADALFAKRTGRSPWLDDGRCCWMHPQGGSCGAARRSGALCCAGRTHSGSDGRSDDTRSYFTEEPRSVWRSDRRPRRASIQTPAADRGGQNKPRDRRTTQAQ